MNINEEMFKVGDKVQITHKVESEDGWGDMWVDHMDSTIGLIGVIIGVDWSCNNIFVLFDNSDDWCYPPSALKLVD